MGKKVAIFASVVVVAVVGWLVFAKYKNVNPVTQTATTPTATDGVVVGTNDKNVTVAIRNSAYTTDILKIKKGTTVTWKNEDSVSHNVVSDSDSPSKGLDLPLAGKGGTISFTFNETGIYKYHCTPHPFMKATVEVTD